MATKHPNLELAKRDPQAILEAVVSFACELDGIPVSVGAGERVAAGHQIVREHPDRFKPVEPSVRFRVEDTTAEPGRKRGGK